MNFKKKLLTLFFLLTVIIPTNAFAYSSKVILGGNNIGITVNTKEVLVVGFYKVDGKSIAEDAGIKIGDKITHIENIEVDSISTMVELINKKMTDNTINVTVLRNGKSLNFKLDLIKEDGVYKTGLYIKDEITGIGTLTYIDPESKVYGALGHEKHLWRSTAKISNISNRKQK